jgi:hypothetical protein
MPALELAFASLRSDWYASNQAVSRSLRQTISGQKQFVFVGFPRQWIPLFEYLGVPWKRTIAPRHYIPIASDLPESQLLRLVRAARSGGMLRTLVESFSVLDAIIADCLYIIDHSVASPAEADLQLDSSGDGSPSETVLLNGWQSYGRPSVRALEARVQGVNPSIKIAVALPCARRRPYERSPTHRRIYALLREQGFQMERVHRLVITSLGIIPEEVWTLPQVLRYDCGVPDIYRILRLGRAYFGRVNYDCVVDCLQFEPYSDVLRILHSEGVIRQLRRVAVPKSRQFVVRS